MGPHIDDMPRDTYQYLLRWEAGDTHVLADFRPGYDRDNRPSLFRVSVEFRGGAVQGLDMLVCEDLVQQDSFDSRTTGRSSVLSVGPSSQASPSIWCRPPTGVTLTFSWRDASGALAPRAGDTVVMLKLEEVFSEGQ
jgi:hypothetical protein